jgi:acetyl-CoA carboxylase biotin carboxyl carrier protein
MNMARIEVAAEVTGKVWKILAPVGTAIEAEDTVMVVESMKMEIPVISESAGTVVELKVAEGDAVEDGQVVAIVES